jgi:lipoate-protein ligase A
MPRISNLRVIIDSTPNSGRWNMAVDEVLLQSAIASNLASLRFYQWSVPTVSLGYFQDPTELQGHSDWAALPVVRRLSGGGAIIHDQESTYSVTLPSSQRLFRQPQELYDIVHQGLSQGLHEMGFIVQCRGQALKRPDEPLLCFRRQNVHDIVFAGQKVVGSAQRRRRGAILQHGSLIRHASTFALEIKGLEQLAGSALPEGFTGILAAKVANVLAESWTIGTLTTGERELAKQLSQQNEKSM